MPPWLHKMLTLGNAALRVHRNFVPSSQLFCKTKIIWKLKVKEKYFVLWEFAHILLICAFQIVWNEASVVKLLGYKAYEVIFYKIMHTKGISNSPMFFPKYFPRVLLFTWWSEQLKIFWELGHLGGSVIWVSNSWFRLRSWSCSCEIESCIKLWAGCGACLRFSLSLSQCPFPLCVHACSQKFFCFEIL